MILITGAAGKTGRAILSRLVTHGVRVRSLVRTEAQKNAIKKIGNLEIIIGDLRDQATLERAVEGIRKIYFISPNMAPDEFEIGDSLINLAQKAGVDRFVYHSVMHPHVESMPHHWQKMRVEEKIFESGIDFTILQPCAYMQNILPNWKSIYEESVYTVPYATSARISMVDLEDVAAAAETVLTQLNHSNAIYELAGPEALSQVEVAEAMSTVLNKPVRAEELNRAVWADNAHRSGLNENSIRTLRLMFEYYENFGFSGNANILNYLLKRPATKFSEFLRRFYTADQRIRANGNHIGIKETSNGQ